MSKLDNSTPRSNGDGLRSVPGSQLVHDVFHMNFDSLFGYLEQLGYITIFVSGGDLMENLYLARGQMVVAHVLGKLGSHVGRDAQFAGVHLADGLRKLAGWHVLRQVSAGAGGQGAPDLSISFERGQHHDASLRELRADCNQGVDSADVGESQIHERDVGLMVAILLDGLGAIGCLGYQQHIGLATDNGRNPLPKKRVVIHAEDADRIWIAHLFSRLCFQIRLWKSDVARNDEFNFGAGGAATHDV